MQNAAVGHFRGRVIGARIGDETSHEVVVHMPPRLRPGRVTV